MKLRHKNIIFCILSFIYLLFLFSCQEQSFIRSDSFTRYGAQRVAYQLSSIAELVMNPNPWLHLEANSEQRQPVYIGATPREIALNFYPYGATEAKLPESLRVLREKQLEEIR